MWVAKMDMTVRAMLPMEEDALAFSGMPDPLTSYEKTRVNEAVAKIVVKKGLSGGGEVDIYDYRREYVYNLHTLERSLSVVAKVAYVAATFINKLELGRFKLTHPEVMKMCQIVEK